MGSIESNSVSRSALGPTSAPPGSPDVTLTVNGTGFVSSSVVKWNGTALSTQFISRSQLTATIPASRLAKAQTASVTVVNPASPSSNVAYFSVVKPVASVAFSGSQFPSTGKESHDLHCGRLQRRRNPRFGDHQRLAR